MQVKGEKNADAKHSKYAIIQAEAIYININFNSRTVHKMIYPYLTLNDGTEYTHSEMKTDGTVLVYVETPDAEDGFHSLVCVLPKYEIKDVIGYTKQEQKKILERIKKNAHLMIKYAQIGGFESDAATA